MKIKILIIENEYNSVKGAFSAANLFDFNSELDIINEDKAQNIIYNELKNFDVIFIDISLATKSVLDGLGIIEKISTLSYGAILLKKIVILTGDHDIDNKIKNIDIPYKDFPILKKPINFNHVTEVIKVILKKNQNNN